MEYLVFILVGVLFGWVGTTAYYKYENNKHQIVGSIVVCTDDPMKDIYTLQLDDLADLETKDEVTFKIIRA